MKIYNYDSNGIYTGSRDARADPMNKNRYLIPANATKKAPPLAVAKQVAQFVNNAWQLVDDNRGDEVYQTADGANVTVDYVGPLKSEHTATQRPDVYYTFVNGQWVLDGLLKIKHDNNLAIAELGAIDAKSIRDIREYIVAQSDAPQSLKDLEAAAVVERGKIQGAP